MKLLLKLMYHGGAYHGFQIQPDVVTVQGTLMKCFEKAFGFPCKVTGCSRTDAGVHARGYCCTVEPDDGADVPEVWCTVPAGKIHRFLGIHLPSDVTVVGACYVDNSFHPRYNAKSKEYVYVIRDSVVCDPFLSDRQYQVKHYIDDAGLARMNEAAEKLLGYHDFASFVASGSSIEDTRRTLHRLDARRTGEFEVTVTAAADGFLYNMVRILTGTLLEVAVGKISPDEMTEILESRDRRRAGFTAPPHGLYLNRVDYGDSIEFAAD